MELRFFYDIVCPYAYLASTQIRAIAERTGAELLWEPMLLGGVFKAIGAPQAVPTNANKARLNLLDMTRWADHFGVTLRMPGAHPRRTVEAMRAIHAAGDARVAATEALFAAYWVDGLDITDRGVIAEALTTAGLDGGGITARIDEPDIKDALRVTTGDAVSHGVFGAPAFVVGGRLYWGQDRLQFVEAALSEAA